MRNLTRNMAFLMKAIADVREKYGLPRQEPDSFTSLPEWKKIKFMRKNALWQMQNVILLWERLKR